MRRVVSEAPMGGAIGTVPSAGHLVAAPRLQLTVELEAGVPTSRQVLLDGDLFRIGSHESNDLVLKDPEVSRFHCRVDRGGKAWRLTDTNSLNGTRVHGIRIEDADLASPECLIDLGGSRVRIRDLPPEGELEMLDRPNCGDLYGTSFSMRRLFAIIERVAQSDRTVLVEGESGTGKELVAAEIVRQGARARKPFVIVDCGAISPQLIEAELFGHAKGAFTGAERDRVGAFEAADGGTILLDEIGEMPMEMQPKLLRVLESREIRRVGEAQGRKLDVRVIAATNRRLEREINQGRFREDLFFRLSVVIVRVPPLRERVEDIPLLVQVLLESMGAQSSSHLFTRDVLGKLAHHDWPGNVRELRNFVDRSVALGVPGSSLHEIPGEGAPSTALPPVDLGIPFRQAKERAISEFELAYLVSLLEWAEGNVSQAARKAGMARMNLHRLIQRYGLRPGPTLKD